MSFIYTGGDKPEGPRVARVNVYDIKVYAKAYATDHALNAYKLFSKTIISLSNNDIDMSLVLDLHCSRSTVQVFMFLSGFRLSDANINFFGTLCCVQQLRDLIHNSSLEIKSAISQMITSTAVYYLEITYVFFKLRA